MPALLLILAALAIITLLLLALGVIVTFGVMAAILFVVAWLLQELTKPVATVAGKVTYGDQSQVGGVTMRLLDVNANAINSATTDDTGAYVFQNVPEGDYVVDAHKDLDDGTGSWLGGQAQITVTTGGDVSVPDLALVTDNRANYEHRMMLLAEGN